MTVSLFPLKLKINKKEDLLEDLFINEKYKDNAWSIVRRQVFLLHCVAFKEIVGDIGSNNYTCGVNGTFYSDLVDILGETILRTPYWDLDHAEEVMAYWVLALSFLVFYSIVWKTGGYICTKVLYTLIYNAMKLTGESGMPEFAPAQEALKRAWR